MLVIKESVGRPTSKVPPTQDPLLDVTKTSTPTQYLVSGHQPFKRFMY